MITEQERIQRETLKQLLKQFVENNPRFTPFQKQIAKENIDRAESGLDSWYDKSLRILRVAIQNAEHKFSWSQCEPTSMCIIKE